MRHLIYWFAAAAMVAAAQPPIANDTRSQQEQSGSIEGKITDAATGAPIEQVAVRSSGGITSALTDSTGHYVLKDLPAGTHMVWPYKNGYGSPTSATPRRIRLARGQWNRNLDFQLRKGAALTGRVLDRQKVPVAGSRVVVWLRDFQESKPIFSFRGSAKTDDLGRYSLPGLGAGDYYLGAFPPKQESHLPARTKAGEDRKPQVRDVRVFYPNAFSIDVASRITLGPSEQRDGVDVTLDKRETFCAQFSVAAFTSNSQTEDIYFVLIETAPGFRNSVADGTASANGGQEVCGLPPSSYFLTILTNDPAGGVSSFASKEFEIANRNVALGPLQLEPGHGLSGKITIAEAKPEDTPPSGIVVSLSPAQRRGPFVGEARHARVEASGDFLFRNVLSDKYKLKVTGLPPGYYVESARLAGMDVLGTPFLAAGGELRIVLRADGPAVSGLVVNKEQQSVANALVLLTVKDSTQSRLTFETRSDEDGAFQFRSDLIPGDYLLFAVSGLANPSRVEEPEALQQYLSEATKLTLAKKDEKSVTVTAQSTQ